MVVLYFLLRLRMDWISEAYLRWCNCIVFVFKYFYNFPLVSHLITNNKINYKLTKPNKVVIIQTDQSFILLTQHVSWAFIELSVLKGIPFEIREKILYWDFLYTVPYHTILTSLVGTNTKYTGISPLLSLLMHIYAKLN